MTFSLYFYELFMVGFILDLYYTVRICAGRVQTSVDGFNTIQLDINRGYIFSFIMVLDWNVCLQQGRSS